MADQYDEVERKATALTGELSKKCHGHGSLVVVAAGLNIVSGAALRVPDPMVRKGLAESLRNIATKLEEGSTGITH